MVHSKQQKISDARGNILAAAKYLMAGKGFSSVGITEILVEANAAKGSFYHYFESKNAFGVALLYGYFLDYLEELEKILQEPGLTMAQRLTNYWHLWQTEQSFDNFRGKCLAVKLAAEVADLSDSMRAVLRTGTQEIVDALSKAITAGVADGSFVNCDAAEAARSLYQLWLGASVMVKIERSSEPFRHALLSTYQILRLSPSAAEVTSDYAYAHLQGTSNLL